MLPARIWAVNRPRSTGLDWFGAGEKGGAHTGRLRCAARGSAQIILSASATASTRARASCRLSVGWAQIVGGAPGATIVRLAV